VNGVVSGCVFLSAAAGFGPSSTGGATNDKSALSNDLMRRDRHDHADPRSHLASPCCRTATPKAGFMRPSRAILLYAVFGTQRALAWALWRWVSLMRRLPWAIIARSGHEWLCVAALTLAFAVGCHVLVLGVFQAWVSLRFPVTPVSRVYQPPRRDHLRASQIKHLLGIAARAAIWQRLLMSIWANLECEPDDGRHRVVSDAVSCSGGARLKPFFACPACRPAAADVPTKAGRWRLSLCHDGAVWFLISRAGVKIVGAVPQSLPPLTMPICRST